jgi:hypothetical protein
MQARIKRPSPALVVAIVALIAALTGTAWAALGKNSVGSKQLKKNSITTAKVKNEAITTAKVKNETITAAKVQKGTLTGAQINLSTLGKVPNAVSADTASNLVGQQNFFVRLNGGQSQTIATNGAVSLVASCEANVGGKDKIKIFGQTTAPGSIQDGIDDLTGPAGTGEFLEPNTPAEKREFVALEVATGGIYVESNIDQGFVLGPELKMIAANAEGIALGLNYGGTTCLAAGVINLISG